MSRLDNLSGFCCAFTNAAGISSVAKIARALLRSGPDLREKRQVTRETTQRKQARVCDHDALTIIVGRGVVQLYCYCG